MARPIAHIEAALDGALYRLHESRLIIGHGEWIDGRCIGRRLQVAPRGSGPAHLLIATALPHDDLPHHDGPCPAAPGGAVLRIFDPTCHLACPERCGGEAEFLARRLARAIAAATAESPERIARIIRNAPPYVARSSPTPLSLIDALFA